MTLNNSGPNYSLPFKSCSGSVWRCYSFRLRCRFPGSPFRCWSKTLQQVLSCLLLDWFMRVSRSEDNSMEHANSVLCFLHLSSRVQAPVISFGNRSLSLLSHLAGLLFGNSYESQLEYIRLTLNSLVLLLQLVRHCFIGEMTTKLVLGVSVLRAGLCLSVLWRSCLLEMAERVRREDGSG